MSTESAPQQQDASAANGVPVEPASAQEISVDSKESNYNEQDINQINGDANDGDSASNPIPANATQGGREINKKVLYVGNIDQHVTEDMLNDVFKVTGTVVSIKIFPDKNKRGLNYAFVEYDDTNSADIALRTLNGRAINQSEITINWAYQSLNVAKAPELYNVFVGDLSSDVNDEYLAKAFASFGSMIEAHVMWDMTTGRSRGYGFVTFHEHQDALRAIQAMNGEWLGSRAIRCNWASQKSQQNYHNQMQHNHHQQMPQQMHHHQYSGQNQMFHPHHQQQNYGNMMNSGSGGNQGNSGNGGSVPIIGDQQLQNQQGPVGQQIPVGQDQNAASGGQYLNQAPPPNAIGSQPPNSMMGMVNPPPMYDMVVRQTPARQTTVYLGNIPPFTTPSDLLPVLQNFGYVMDFKYQQEREYAFIKYDTHEHAAIAISQLSGAQLNGRTLRCGWGRDKHQNNHHNQYQNYGRQYNR